MTRGVVIVALAVCVVGCGNSGALTPAEIAQNYVYAVAEGNYPAACALLYAPTREALVSSTGSRGCPRLFARCLPKGATVLRRDQSQLLYANTDLQIHGSRADVGLSGTAAARATKEVTLVDHRARWRLTSPGRAIERCVGRWSGQRRHRHRRRPAGG